MGEKTDCLEWTEINRPRGGVQKETCLLIVCVAVEL